MDLSTLAQNAQDQIHTLLPGVPLGVVIAALVVIVLILLMAALVLRSYVRLRRDSAKGRSVSAADTGNDPKTSFDKHGHPSDPLNLKVIGTRGQLAAAFAAAGWYRADEIDLVTSFRISADSIFGRKYSTAPVSNLYLYGREEDYAFERPGSSVRNRDHVRFWDTGERSADGRRIWLGGATHDIAVEISKKTHLPTHKIASDVDDERATVVDTLIEGGWVIADGWEPGFGEPTTRTNSLGDSYHTDGRRAVLTLANILVPVPLARPRGKLGLRITRSLHWLWRWQLPKAAHALAEKHRMAKRAKEAAHVSAAGHGEHAHHEGTR